MGLPLTGLVALCFWRRDLRSPGEGSGPRGDAAAAAVADVAWDVKLFEKAVKECFYD